MGCKFTVRGGFRTSSNICDGIFWKIVSSIYLKGVNYSRKKKLILDAWVGSECASGGYNTVLNIEAEKSP